MSEDRVLALAGLHQAVYLVQQVARHGSADPGPLETSIESLFKIDADSTEQVFGGASGVQRGLRVLLQQLDRQQRDLEITRYTVCLLYLERKLSRRKDLMQIVVEGVETASGQLEYFSATHANVLAKLADIYSNTVSTLSPRIMVTGTPAHLNNRTNANRIRALLLAGMRAAVLWRQLGGNRLQLLLGRERLAASAARLLEAAA